MLETSYLVMETHANSTPVQVYATCMCLPKGKAKKHGHCQKILRRLLTTIWQRKAVWKDPFLNKSSGTINPVYLPQTTPEQHKERVNQNNTVYHKCCPRFFILQLMRNIQLTNMTSIVLCFWKTCTGKKCINSYTGLGEG